MIREEVGHTSRDEEQTIELHTGIGRCYVSIIYDYKHTNIYVVNPF